MDPFYYMSQDRLICSLEGKNTHSQQSLGNPNEIHNRMKMLQIKHPEKWVLDIIPVQLRHTVIEFLQ